MTHHGTTAPRESAFAFDCQGDELIGFIHEGDSDCDIGILTIVAGGPQYRAGVGRQLVKLGRRLATDGLHVMRFDYRGVGDSEGEFKDFLHIHDDLAAALREFRQRVPQLRRVILWGGCNAGTAALINAWQFPDVAGIIAGNPYVRLPQAAAKAQRRHYLKRLGEKSFWTKLLTLQYNPLEYLRPLWRRFMGRLFPQPSQASKPAPPSGSTPEDRYIDDMLIGLQQFSGPILFLRGGRFVRSDEFDALVQSTPAWKAAFGNALHEQADISDGDQVFSSQAAQDKVLNISIEWIQRRLRPGSHSIAAAPDEDRQQP